MNRQIYHFMQLSVLFVLIVANSVAAYEDTITHPALTKRAVENTQLDSYLKNQLGLLNGLVTIFPSYSSTKNIRDLLQQGSIAEDHPVCRASNHFHNPLKSWDRAGISSIWWPLCPTWDITDYSTRYSALTWATGLNSFSRYHINRTYQDMGWDNARYYFYSALTAPSNADRETYIAKTFQAMGHVMHLLQDMAVPAHVRNDFWNSHIRTGGFNPYELYVSLPENAGLISNLTKTDIASVTPSFANARPTDFWDTTDGSNDVPPQMSNPTLQAKAGLAEYTNANFVSERTLFSNSTEFQYPRNTSTAEKQIYPKFCS